MKYVLLVVAMLTVCMAVSGQHHGSPGDKPAAIVPGLGQHHHPVSTGRAEAQRFFDQGLTYVYAFNHDEAVRSFKRAAELDPAMAMAYWGIALAVGPNYNLDVDADREKAAYEAIQKAGSLASKCSDLERAYIEALAHRYSGDPKADFKKLAVDYKNAMKDLMVRFPDDLDAATLFAESAMDLRPWQLWSSDGTPAEGTLEIVAVLESVLRRDPQHIGANHFYIHAVEASPYPERALPSAERLGGLAPAAGHLVHMPAHIYIRTGDYLGAAQSNVAGAEADRAYIKASGAQGVYPMMYYSHNLHFLAIASMMEGRFADARTAARQLEANVGPHIKEMPMLDWFMPTTTFILVRFHRWDDILKSAEPDRGSPLANAFWHFGRGMALAATGQIQQARAEEQIFVAARKAMPADAQMGFNTASTVMSIAEKRLGAAIALAGQNRKAAVALLKEAVPIEDSLAYDEPPDWYLPSREALGGALIAGSDYKEAEEVFRAQLAREPRSGRALFGLSESLRGQGKTSAAEMIKRLFEVAWKNADTPLKLADL
jgi:tetratricopeptide (TPR) repeat protein